MPPNQNMFNFYGVFAGNIDQESTQRFFNNFSILTQQPHPNKHLHLLIQSTGGMVAEGVAMYNFLKSAPTDVSIYNAGSLHSMAAIVFLSAKRRVASQTATFMLHRVSCAPKPMPIPIMKNMLGALKIDDDRVDRILKSHLNISEEQWSHFRDNDLWFNATDAIASGIATEIGDFSPPRGAKILSFNL